MVYKINTVRSAKIRDKYIVTTDHGSWLALDKNEYDLLMQGKAEGELLERLKEKGIIVTDENLNRIAEDYRKKNDFLFQGASLHIVIPTLRCNQQCAYCQASTKPAGSDAKDMDEETAQQAVDFIFQSPTSAITIEFQGGEPLLNFPMIKAVAEYAREKNKKYKRDLRITLVTNLSLMSDEILSYLKEKNVWICTSFDGPKHVHDKNRVLAGGSGTYDNVVHWIDAIGPQMGALPTITRYSLPYWKEIINEYIARGFETIHLRYINNLGYARNKWDEIGYNANEFLDFWKKSMDYIIEINKSGKFFTERMALIILQKILTKNDPYYAELQSPCGGVIGQLAYTPDGSVYTCDEGRMVGEFFRLGSVKENNYREVVGSPQACSFIMLSTNDTMLCDTCAWKPWCGLCPVCSYAEQGSPITKLPMSDRCKIHNGMFRYMFEKLVFDENAKNVFGRWLENLKNGK